MKKIISGLVGIAMAAVLIAVTAFEKIPEPVSIGRISDSQGLVSIRPLNCDRWTPVAEPILLAPGDWLRTDVRGANAARIHLDSGCSLIVGPGSLVEFMDPSTLRVTRGELDVEGTEKTPITVGLPGTKADETVGKLPFSKPSVLRVRDSKIEKLDYEPSWLKGFKGAVVKESMGELLVNVDGRDVALTVGYHKVTIDIRDQIVRTVIEESFVNHTNSQLEGIFHFPLPADASISNFGMWIGDNLVEADVVERQRAREIYETILREQRDPGLLEWSGGNIFKARVFPIFPNSEKRVTITYTQVLPMRNGICRYSYPLASEMLRQKPLRELQIIANIFSAAPLKSVACPNHKARLRQTANSASVEFSAQEYCPTKDFELTIEPDLEKQPLTLIPHRRGEDGYFLALLNPPGVSGARPLIGDGNPLRLIILADSSGSMDPAQCEARQEFLRALLSSLGKRDQFMLAACDVDCNWLTAEFQPADEKHTTKVLDSLSSRRSLGWSDLDKAFSTAATKADGNCQILYIGDGIQATSEVDPANFAKRVVNIFKAAVSKGASCHAVATGPSYESSVMKAIAAQGGGSFRRIEGDMGAEKAAPELLEELTQAPLRDLSVEFNGLRAASVYPENMANLPAGSQQIIVGRYLPSSLVKDASIFLTGKLGNRTVKFKQPFKMPEGGAENSFIPRLWARMHLDKLLEQGSSPEIREQIVAFSQEFRIMTPYTSFLVLESDSDRERFGVKRHFAMRDGEAFFAEGREKGSYQLVQQQMKLAATWRAGLRGKVLLEMENLGREEIYVQAPLNIDAPYTYNCLTSPYNYDRIPSETKYLWKDNGRSPRGYAEKLAKEDLKGNADIAAKRGLDLDSVGEETADEEGIPEGPIPRDEGSEMQLSAPSTEPEMKKLEKMAQAPEPRYPSKSKEMVARYLYDKASQGGNSYLRRQEWSPRGSRVVCAAAPSYREEPGAWLNWVPQLPQIGLSKPDKAKPETWTDEAFKLSLSLDRRKSTRDSKTALRILSTQRWHDPENAGALTVLSTTLTVSSPDRWMTLEVGDYVVPEIDWFTSGQYGRIELATRLGRVAKPEKDTPAVCPFTLDDFSTNLISDIYQTFKASVDIKSKDRAEIVLVTQNERNNSVHFLIDTSRNVILEHWNTAEGKIICRTKFEEFKEVAGSWWATRITNCNADGRTSSEIKLEIGAIDANELQKAWNLVELAKKDSILVPDPLPPVSEAKKSFSADKADADQLISLISHFAATQRWDRTVPIFDVLRKKTGQKYGFLYLELGFLSVSRRNEEQRKLSMELCAEFVKNGLGLEKYLELIPAAQIPEKCGEHEYLRSLTNRLHSFQPNEQLEFLELLKPVYYRQSDRLNSKMSWLQEYSDKLYGANQYDASLEILKKIVADNPQDSNTLIKYARRLADTGEIKTAVELLENALKTPHKRWQQYQLSNIQNTMLDIFERAGWHDRQIPFLVAIIGDKKATADQNLCQKYLTVLLKADREPEADKIAIAWLNPVTADAKLNPAELAKALAAANYMLGNIHQYHYYSSNWIDERWLELLGRTVESSAEKTGSSQIARTIMGDPRFGKTDICRKLRAKFANYLQGDISKTDFTIVQSFLVWIEANDPAVEEDAWKKIAANLEKCWALEIEAFKSKNDPIGNPSLNQFTQWGYLATDVYRNHLDPAEYLRFCRRQFTEGPAACRDTYAEQLFMACLSQGWSQEIETEAFVILDKLACGDGDTDKIYSQANALMSLVDWMIEGHKFAIVFAYTSEKRDPGQKALIETAIALTPEMKSQLSKVPAKPMHELTRTERILLDAIALKLSREAAVLRLKNEQGRQPKALLPWFAVERMDIQTRLATSEKGADLAVPAIKSLAEEALGLLEKTLPDKFAQASDLLLFNRQLSLAKFLIIKSVSDTKDKKGKPANSAALDALLAYCGAGEDCTDKERRIFWRKQIYEILLALDRPAELETFLRKWIKADESFSPWRVPLAYLLAETDRIPEAVTILETVESGDELGASEYKALSGWYMALDKKEQYHSAKISQYESMGDYPLQELLYNEQNKLSRHRYDDDDGVPANLDPDTIDILTVYLRKSQNPSSCMWTVRDIYGKTRDFRLLKCLVEGMLGHSAQQIYPLFLKELHSILNEIRDEATADQLLAAIGEIRRKNLTPVDRRALFLLEADVKRRASEVLNQPGQHLSGALAALKAAFRESWSQGEPRLMAEYLADLGKISQESLATEQLNQLETLYKRTEESAIDRLEIAQAYAHILGYYSKYDKGIAVMVGALEEYRRASGGTLNWFSNSPMETLISFFENQRHFVQGEKWMRTELGRPTNETLREWLLERLFNLYEKALQQGAETALGSRQALYKAVNIEIIGELGGSVTPRHLAELISRYCGIANDAKNLKLEGVADNIKLFAAEVLPAVLQRLSRDSHFYQQSVGTVATALHNLVSARDGLAFLILRAENEPKWLRFSYDSFWQRHSSNLALWRTEVKDLGDLEPRLLAIVLCELRYDLERQQARSREMYAHNSGHFFWQEKAEDFAKVAEEVYAKRSASGFTVNYIAWYMFEGLDLKARAINMLFDAWRRELLDETGQFTLIEFLHRCERYKESIPVAEKLVKWRPDNIQYRRYLIVSYARSGQMDSSEQARQSAEDHFKKIGMWDENVISVLANACLDSGIFKWAVAYFDEVIALHKRTFRASAGGDGTLSQYYAYLAKAHAGLGNTPEAVDAAAGAVISWGRSLDNRRESIGTLVQILSESKNLDGYVETLNRQVEKTKLDSPIVRKALGQVYSGRNEHEKAVIQFRLAIKGQPNDMETHEALIASLDALNQPEQAVEQLLDLGELLPREISIRQKAYDRLISLKQPLMAERAATSIVEAAPTEAETHQALAELRQKQDRWEAAASHWKRVCEFRALEPTGLLGLAKAQVRLGKTAEAKDTVNKILAKKWPDRFLNVQNEARELLKK